MRRITNFQIQKESFEDACRARRFNPSLQITFRDRTGMHTHKISAGYSDELDVFREDGVTYVLARNNALPYVGLEAFQGHEKVGDLFLQEGQVNEVLGRSNLASVTIIKLLQPYLMQ